MLSLLRRKTEPTTEPEPEAEATEPVHLSDLAGGARAIQIIEAAEQRILRDPGRRENHDQVRAQALWDVFQALRTGAPARQEPEQVDLPGYPAWASHANRHKLLAGSGQAKRLALVERHGWTWEQVLSLSGGDVERAVEARLPWGEWRARQNATVAAKHAARAAEVAARRGYDLPGERERLAQAKMNEQRNARGSKR
ncbi:hypothetical protein DYH09_13855 [bacterium CPR1]|nr:hypothetical protein [bacterium CPR1]